MPYWPVGHWYELFRLAQHSLEFGSLTITRSWPRPNIGPQSLRQKMAYRSFSGFKGIFVGGRPLGLTRLNKNEPDAFPQSPEAKQKGIDIHHKFIHYIEGPSTNSDTKKALILAFLQTEVLTFPLLFGVAPKYIISTLDHCHCRSLVVTTRMKV